MKYYSIILTLFLLIQCSDKRPNLHKLQGDMYGSTYAIQYYSDKAYDKEIISIMNDFDAIASTYKQSSELSQFNSNKIKQLENPMLIDLIKICKHLNTQTDGYYDPTVEPLMTLWGFSKKELFHNPSQHEIDSVLNFIGLNKLSYEKGFITKRDKSTRLNFNSITGYINDTIGGYLDSKGLKSYLIEIGGEIKAKGLKEDSTNWIVGIDVPKEGAQEIYSAFPLYNQSLATSGNYRKFFIDSVSGKKVVHTMNPKNGMPQISKLLSATVIANKCSYADGYATALMAMGFDNAKVFLENSQIKALLIYSDEKGNFNEINFNDF